MKKLFALILCSTLCATALSGCLDQATSEPDVTTIAKGVGDADPTVVILDGVVTVASGPNVSSPWVTINGTTSLLIVNNVSLPSQNITVTCHATSFTSVTNLTVGLTLHARCDNHQSLLYISDVIYPL